MACPPPFTCYLGTVRARKQPQAAPRPAEVRRSGGASEAAALPTSNDPTVGAKLL